MDEIFRVNAFGMTRREWLQWCAASTLVGGAVSCRDKQAEAAKLAMPAVETLLPLVQRDTKQLRDGLPKGAEVMSKHLDKKPANDPEGIRRAIGKARQAVDDLAVAKGTFFIFVSPDGVVLRGESEPDLAADHSLVEAVPTAKAMLKKGAGLTEAWGYMKGLRGVNFGNDVQWIVGHPVEVDGDYVGTFASGFSLRAYAKVLEIALQSYLAEQQEDKTKAPPLGYPFLIKGPKAYGGAVTPDENMEALAALDLVSKTEGGPFEGDLDIDGRTFHLAAQRAPSLAPDAVVAVTLSAV